MNNSQNHDRSQRLFEAMGLIDEQYIPLPEPQSEPQSAPQDSPPTRVRLPRWQLFAPLAACLAIIIAAAVVFGGIDSHKEQLTPSEPLAGGITGLPTRNYMVCVGIHAEGYYEPSFTRYFAALEEYDDFRVSIIRVEEIIADKREGGAAFQWRITARVLADAASSNADHSAGGVVQILERHYGYETYFRVGGAYIVPIGKLGEGYVHHDYYMVSNHFTALFEIDENELIYSHSRHHVFDYFDGKPYSVLVGEIERLNANLHLIGDADFEATFERREWESERLQLIFREWEIYRHEEYTRFTNRLSGIEVEMSNSPQLTIVHQAQLVRGVYEVIDLPENISNFSIVVDWENLDLVRAMFHDPDFFASHVIVAYFARQPDGSYVPTEPPVFVIDVFD
jgi:hypothetical protein